MFSCDIENCNYKTKKKQHLTTHKWLVHHIGDEKWFPCNMSAKISGYLNEKYHIF